MIWKWTDEHASLDVLRAELRDLPAPEPPTDLLQRALASRGAGVRLVLPLGERGPVQLRYLRHVAVIAGVAGLGWLAFVAGRPGAEQRAEGPPARLVDGTLFFPSAAFGRQAMRQLAPRYPPITRIDPSGVRPGRWTYELLWITDRVFTSSQGKRTIALTAGSYEGRPAWLMTDPGHVSRRPSWFGDTVFVDQASLRPLRYARSMRRARLIQQFSRDSVTERLDVASPKERHFKGAAALPGAPGSPVLVSWSPYSLDALVQALPLEHGWRGSVYTVNWISMSDRLPAFTPLDLSVVRSERVTVPAGRFDCWKLEVREGDEESFLWVSKAQRWVVKKQHTWSGESGEWQSEARLVSADTSGAPMP